MPRPTRAAATLRKNYSEKNSDDEEDEEAMGSEDDESFDEDDDPDKIEVPGGGKTLEAAVQMKNEPTVDMKKSSGSMLPPPSHSVPKMHGYSLLGDAIPSSSAQFGFDSRYSSPMASSATSLLGPILEHLNPMNPVNSILNPVFSKFLSSPLVGQDANSEQFANFYRALLGSNPNAFFGKNMPAPFQPGMMINQLPMNPKPLPGVNVSNLWASGNLKMGSFLGKEVHDPGVEEDDDNQEDEELGVAETYSDYKPSKLKIGKRHPDPVVETASLASVLPPEVYYKLHLPDKLINSGLLSALQLEAVVYACQQHEHFLQSGERAGYLVGDGAGVGKGRTIAGTIYENYQCGRKKAIWVSVSTDLKYDSERDLKDIGASIDVYPLNKFKYGRINSSINNFVKKGVIFSTYSSLIGESSQGGKFNTRLKQLLDWCGKDFDGVIVFDECHRAKNLCPVGSSKPTKTGQTVFELQKQLPKARVVYASATGASEPKNMAYMTRLGIWGPGTPFKEFGDFINAVEKRGIGAMEIVAMDMKLRGTYIARQLSFQGVAFNIDEVPLSPSFISVYDESVQLWVEAMQKFIEATELMNAESRTKKAIWAQFWSAHQRFFKYLCIASKVAHAVKVATESVKCGKCVVIGLQSTGEARTLDQLERDEGELTDFVSTAKGVFQSLVEKHFPAPNKNKINELLGLSTTSSLFDEVQREMEMDQQPCSSSSAGKRKPVRKAAQKAVKRVRMADSDESDSEIENDSDYNNSAGSSSESYASDSEASNDDFQMSSDMDSDDDDDDPKKKKKKKKGKAAPKGPTIKAQNGAPRILPSKAASDRAWQMKTELLDKIEQLGDKLPPNTLDQLIDELGGPDDVAEMTGRKGRVIQTDQGQIQYESRSETDVSLETINLTEKRRFMDGEKEIAIISEAASSGISLQSDRRAKNQRRRVHITLELPWSADRAIQQFGRTHRSNQVNAPEYVFLISDLAGEHRFASIVAKRLESLGALTHGDRRATESRDLSRFHIDNKYGRAALESVMKYIIGWERSPMAKPPADYVGDFRSDVAAGLVGVGLIVNSEENRGMPTLEKDYNNMSKFLNRILGMPVKLQNALFQYFIDTLNAIVSHAKKTGRFDMGILDLGEAGSGEMIRENTDKFRRKHATGHGEIELHKLIVERGMSWSESQEKYAELLGKHEGYYLSHQVRNGKQTALLAIADLNSTTKEDKKDKNAKSSLYSVYRPSTGLQARRETLGEIQNKGTKVKPDVAHKHWVEQYESSKKLCTHAYWRGNCKNRVAGLDCEIGLRSRTYHVLSGAVLLVWDEVERVLTHHAVMAKMQIVRVKSADGMKLVGLLIPNSCAHALSKALRKAEAEEVAKEKSFAIKEEVKEENE